MIKNKKNVDQIEFNHMNALHEHTKISRLGLKIDLMISLKKAIYFLDCRISDYILHILQ